MIFVICHIKRTFNLTVSSCNHTYKNKFQCEVFMIRILRRIQQLMAFVCFLCTLVMGYCGVSVIAEYGSERLPLLIGIGMLLVTVGAGYCSILMWRKTAYDLKHNC